jgi:ATP-dependent DNA helicase RecG
MKPQDKEESMRQFKEHEADILVATSVIEVGVDVPNATVMVIESAERFGLSQLHQLRGRVGRGGEQSYCILMSGEKLSKEARQRLQAMCETNDGFRLAELDMKLRGAGDINGTQQSGEAFNLAIANPTLDAELLAEARQSAIEILAEDSTLAKAENAGLKALKARHAGMQRYDFSMIS